jgi:putative lipoprotein
MPTQEHPRQPVGQANVSGTIELQAVTQPASNATVRVRVQDTSRTDAPASTVAEEVLTGVNIALGGVSIPFTVRGIPQDPRARYTVRVHVDLDGSGVVTRGDYVSTQSHPVPASGEPGTLTIAVRPVQ